MILSLLSPFSLNSRIPKPISSGYFYQILKFIILVNKINNISAIISSEYSSITDNVKNITILQRLPSQRDFLYNENFNDNFKNSDVQSEEYRLLKRLPKLFTFYADDEDIKVEFEFKVPFIDIPVKRSANTLKDYAKGLVNVNIPAIFLSAIIIISGIGIGKLFQPNHYINPLSAFHIGKEQRSTDTKKTQFDSESLPFKLKYKNSKGFSSDVHLIDLVEDIENMLQGKNIDLISCVQKFTCSRIHNIYDGYKVGSSTGISKIFDGLLSSKFLRNYMKDTAILEAIDIGRSGHDCIEKYENCKWSLTNFDTIIDHYIKSLE